jgi:DNA repair exonuclease SbcCD ATPase subunit
MFRRSFLVDHNIHFHPDLRFTDDLAFTYTALALADRISVIDKPLVNYRTKREGSLWTKLNENPTDVVDALREARRRIAEVGVLDEIEPAFANAVLDQCLYNLSTLRTREAFQTLYDELKSEAFPEFGLFECAEDTFVSSEEYCRLVRIMNSSAEQYLFDEMRSKDEALAGQHERLKQMRERLEQTSERLKETTKRLGETTKALDQTSKRLTLVQAKLDAITRRLPHRIERAIVAVPRSIRRYIRSLRG